jgi:hypothetical protein
MQQSPLEKPNVAKTVIKFPAVYAKRRFIAIFTRPRQYPPIPSQFNLIETVPPTRALTSILSLFLSGSVQQQNSPCVPQAPSISSPRSDPNNICVSTNTFV